MSDSNRKTSTPNQLVIKVQFNDDIRKMIVSNDNLTVNSLNSLMRKIFDGKISNFDVLILKYLDNDGDQVTLVNDVDLSVALHFHSKLRLFVYIDGKTTKKSDENWINELKQIRDSVEAILDRCEIVKENETIVPEVSSPSVPPVTSRESDSFAHISQRQRSNTPNTVRSRIFNTNRKVHIDSTSSESVETRRPPVNPFPTPFPPAPHLIPSGINNQFSPMSSPSTPPTNNPNIPLYATRAFPSARHSATILSPSRSSPSSSFIGQPPTPTTNFFNPAQQYNQNS